MLARHFKWKGAALSMGIESSWMGLLGMLVTKSSKNYVEAVGRFTAMSREFTDLDESDKHTKVSSYYQ